MAKPKKIKETRAIYAVRPPYKKMLDEFPLSESMGLTEDGAWKKFCGATLRREGYEADGFKAVKVILTLEEV